MDASGDDVAAALTIDFEAMISAVPAGWCRRGGGVVAGFTGSVEPTLNGVWQQDPQPDVAVVAALLDQVAAEGVPHCLQVRADPRGELKAVASDRGMTSAEEIPLMLLADPAKLVAPDAAPDLRIHQLKPDEALIHATVAAAGFGAPLQVFIDLMTAKVLSVPGLRCYVGEIDGEPVTTGLGVTIGAHVGVFNIATPPEHRGHGYGAAITTRVLTDGFESGARWSYLQSSADGYGIYQRLGYTTIERWHCYTTPDD